MCVCVWHGGTDGQEWTERETMVVNEWGDGDDGEQLNAESNRQLPAGGSIGCLRSPHPNWEGLGE